VVRTFSCTYRAVDRHHTMVRLHSAVHDVSLTTLLCRALLRIYAARSPCNRASSLRRQPRPDVLPALTPITSRIAKPDV
jgi:hypothetical protein